MGTAFCSLALTCLPVQPEEVFFFLTLEILVILFVLSLCRSDWNKNKLIAYNQGLMHSDAFTLN